MSNNCNFFRSNNCCTIKGDKGEKGEIGFTGMQGNKGQKGVKGEKGEQARIEPDININSIRVNTIRAINKVKVGKLAGPYELGVTPSNTLEVNSNVIPIGDTLNPFDEASYSNFDLGSTIKPWSNLYVRNINSKKVTINDVNAQDISLNRLGAYSSTGNNVFIDGNLISNGNFNLGSTTKSWDNIYTTDLSANSITTTDITARNLYNDLVRTTFLQTRDISATNVYVDDISSNYITVNNLNTLFDISSVNIYGEKIKTSNFEGVQLKINEIISDNSENVISISGNIIPTDISQNIGDISNNWSHLFVNNVNVNTVKTSDISNNISIEGNLIPSGEIKDASNIVQLNIGDSENIWNRGYINDISVNKISALFSGGSDISRNIAIEGNLLPAGPYTASGVSAYSLGSSTKQWKDLHISTGTIFIGGAAISLKEVVENGKKRVELLFFPKIDETQERDSEVNKAITVAGAEFNIVEEEEEGNIKEVLEPIEESFGGGKLLDLEDVDISKNELRNGDVIMYDESKEKFIIGETAVANASNQTLLEILTEQPEQFTLDSSSNTSGTITLEWNYDDIIVNYFDNTHRILSKGNNLKEKMLPYIDKIHVDISGTIHGLPNNENNNIWIPYNIGDYNSSGNRIIADNDSYNTSSYKSLIINKTQASNLTSSSSLVERILSEPLIPISFRIYGINDSKDSDEMKSNRALYYDNLSFLAASPPKKPIFESENITNSNINLVYKTSETEEGNITSAAKIIKAKVNYREVERNISTINVLSSAPYIVNNIEQILEFPFSTSHNIINNTPIPLSITNFRPGTKYSYQVSLTNNLVSTESEISNLSQTAQFTDAPASLNSNQLYFFIEDSDKTNIATTDNLNNGYEFYINIGDSNTSSVVLSPKLSNNSNPSSPQNNADIELSSDFRLGKDLDGTQGADIVNIDVYVDSTHKQKVKFNGYNVASTVSDLTSNNDIFNNYNNLVTLPNTFNFVSNETKQNDMYYDNSIANYQDKMGFRLKANVVLSEIKISDVRTFISNTGNVNPFILKYEYTRKAKLYQNNSDNVTNNSFSLFIDNLNVNPSFPLNSRITPTIEVTNILYCMGIPTVHKFDVIFNTTQSGSSRIYKNNNSIFGFMRGDLKIGDIQIVGETITLNNRNTSVKEIKLQNNTTIKKVNNPEYNLSETNFESEITDYFKNFQYAENNYSTTNNIKVKEKIYSLRTGDDGLSVSDLTLNTKHYCDFNSFNSFTSNNPSIKITDNIVEIDDISNFSNNIGNIQISDYSHENLVKNHTLLFINGKFQTNQKQSYPVVGNYLYQNKTLLNTGYTSDMASVAYDINGQVTSSGKKYKWIGFKLTSANITVVSNISYVNIYSILRNYFNGETFDKLKENNDDDVIGFIKVGNNIGNLSRNYNTLSPWDGISSATSLANVFNNVNKGSIFTSSPNWGPVVNPSTTGNGIFIFIGLNNAESL